MKGNTPKRTSYNSGVHHKSSKAKHQTSRAGSKMNRILKLANSGRASAMFELGVMYDEGQGVEQDYKVAAEWYLKAANLGDASAMSNLGVMYDRGQGVEQDYTKAAELYRQAATLGCTSGMNNLGELYREGSGVTQDFEEALVWYSKAANLGNSESMFMLGLMYQNGQGVAQSHGTAAEWVRKAVESGHQGAVAYLRDQGIPQDSVAATLRVTRVHPLAESPSTRQLVRSFQVAPNTTREQLSHLSKEELMDVIIRQREDRRHSGRFPAEVRSHNHDKIWCNQQFVTACQATSQGKVRQKEAEVRSALKSNTSWCVY